MRGIRVVVALLGLSSTALAAPMTEMKGLQVNEGCLESSVAATEKLRTCPVDKARMRIWCPNGKVFDRDTADAGVAVMRSICEMNQLSN